VSLANPLEVHPELQRLGLRDLRGEDEIELGIEHRLQRRPPWAAATADFADEVRGRGNATSVGHERACIGRGAAKGRSHLARGYSH
jgi:hypothetical protein